MKKTSKVLLGLGSVATVVAPLAATVSCGSEDTINIAVGVPTPDKAAELNKSLDGGDSLGKEIVKNLKLGKNVNFIATADNEQAAQGVVSGQYLGAFLPSGLLGKHKDDLAVPFLSSRPALKFNMNNTDADNKIKDGAARGKVLSALNSYYDKLRTDFNGADKDKIYGKPAVFYRSEIYTNDRDVMDFWNDTTKQKPENLAEFMNFGVITHGTTSESGYIIPQQMIKEHFHLKTDFNFTDYTNNVKTGGNMSNFDKEHHIYFSFLGETLQKTSEKRSKIETLIKSLYAVAVSKPIINDGFGVSTRMDQTSKDGLLKAAQAAVKTSKISGLFYHEGYSVPTPDDLKELYKKQ